MQWTNVLDVRAQGEIWDGGRESESSVLRREKIRSPGRRINEKWSTQETKPGHVMVENRGERKKKASQGHCPGMAGSGCYHQSPHTLFQEGARGQLCTCS